MRSDGIIHQRAQILRKNMTKEERHLWYDFLKAYPIQFKRQYPNRELYCGLLLL